MTHTPASGPFGPLTTPAMSFSAARIAAATFAPTRVLLVGGANDVNTINRGAATSTAREIEIVDVMPFLPIDLSLVWSPPTRTATAKVRLMKCLVGWPTDGDSCFGKLRSSVRVGHVDVSRTGAAAVRADDARTA